jgi:hypothetical protein
VNSHPYKAKCAHANLLAFLAYQNDPFGLKPTGFTTVLHLHLATHLYHKDITYKNSVAQQAIAYAQRYKLVFPFLQQILPAGSDADASRKRQHTETNASK